MPKPPRAGFLIAVAVVIQLATVGLLVGNIARLLDDDRDPSWPQQIQEQSMLLARALAGDLAAGRRPVVLDTLALLRTDPGLRHASVFDAGGRLVASLGEAPPLAQAPADGFRRRLLQRDGELIVEQPIALSGRTLGLVRTGYDVRPTRRLIGPIMIQSLAIGLLGLLLSAAVVATANRGTGRGLRRLENAIQTLREGDFPKPLPQTAGALGAAGRALDALAAQLHNSRSELSARYHQLLKESRRLTALLDGIHAVVWEVDPKTGGFRYVSEQAVDLLGYPVKDWLDPEFVRRHVHPEDLEWVQGFLTHPGTAADSFTLDFRIHRHDGECLWLRMISTVEIREQGRALAGLLMDVTEEKRSEQRIAYLANHDPLTSLINRRRFQEKLDEQIAYNRRYNAQGALLFIDLDQFKYINDSFGHHTGDEYLRQVADHLRSALRTTDVIGRLGGDEFGVLLPSEMDAERAAKVCAMLLKQLNGREFIHEGRRTSFSASIGIALLPTHGDNAGELLANADSAMYNAKEQGRNTYRVFQESIDAGRMQEKIHWEDRIRHALKHDRFLLYFQPIVDTGNGTIRHYESLLRMLSDDDAVIGPGAFIGVAERFGLIREIDRWVVQHAIRTQGHSEVFGNPVSLTVNLSGRHFGSREILELIEEATRHFKADPSRIIFEVTETAAVENFTAASQFIGHLRQLGYRFALDDFGAGFTSFDYLKRMPVDYIKIDGSFVRNLPKDPIDQIFVKAIVEMARHLGVTAIAEFVENRMILDELRQLGVPLGQGYFFARPGPEFPEQRRVVIRELADSP